MPAGGGSAMQDSPFASFSVNAAPVEGRLSHAETGGASMALQRSVRALDGVERIGRLLTLDLKSNEIKVSPIADFCANV
jgi:protein phosphatase 1 regulatory subunit 37